MESDSEEEERGPVGQGNDFGSCAGYCSPLQSVTAFLSWGKGPFPCLLLFLRVRGEGRLPECRGLVHSCLVGGSFWVALEIPTCG